MKQTFFICLVLILSQSVFPQQNPFRRPAPVTTNSQPPPPGNTPEKTAKTNRSGNRLWKIIPFNREILSAQRALSGKLSSTLRAIKADPGPGTVAILLFFAFLYGIIHSLGPGHAKTLFISHGLSRASPMRATWLGGAVFSITHTGSAIVLFLVFRMALGWKQGQSDVLSEKMVMVSGILIIAAGIIIVLSSVLEKRAQRTAGTFLLHSSGLIPVAVIAGLAPCPGAFLILTFSTVIGILPVGIAAVAAVSSGMAITVSLAGMAGSSIGKSVGNRNSHPVWHIAATGIRYGAAGIIIAIGLLMVTG
jgi:ABC-type nickel/cobalt efflux system permease component RcnA